MDRKMYEMLQKDLQKAISEKDYGKIEQLKQILNVSVEQLGYIDKGMTGFPSIDQIWLEKHYQPGAYDKANLIPENKTVWDVIEQKLIEYYDVPAIEYFKKQTSRGDFIEKVDTWARTFRAMGIEVNEVVPIYGPFFPDICAMVFALNEIGAVPYFLKLAITKDALEEETKEAKVAVVYDGMWKNVAEVFSKDQFKKVLVATVSDSMPSPKKEIVSFISAINARKNKSNIPDDKKYVWLDKAKEFANYYTGDVKVPFEKDRNAFITSSSGTTIGGVVKAPVATNESTISQLLMADASEVQYFPGDRVLNSLPPTASTSLNILFMLPLYKGLTIYNDPRISANDFYNQIIQTRPNLVVNTGSMWEAFFNRIEIEMSRGKRFDFSYAKGWVVGGEVTDVKKFLKWKQIMTLCGAPNGLATAYGSSELFSAACTEKHDARTDFSKTIMSVGIPYAGLTVGVFDENGRELTYNTRGELYIKSKSAMKEYYNKPELTKEVLSNGWVKTGDIAEIDDNGFVYIWGRKKDKIECQDGQSLYLFDVANKIKEFDYISDVIVLSMPLSNNPNSLVAHIVWDSDVDEYRRFTALLRINEFIKEYLPTGIDLVAYSEHEGMLPYLPTTLKKDKNLLSKQTHDYYQVTDEGIRKMEFVMNENGLYDINYEINNDRKQIKR